jgi:hypothetical protein
MPRRALALLCLAACAAPAEPAQRCADGPVPADSRAVPEDSQSCPEDPARASDRHAHVEPVGSGEPVPSSATTGSDSHGQPARPVPKDSPPRLLADEVERFGVLADGALLVLPRATWLEIAGEPTYAPAESLERIDPDTGARTPWGAPWIADGWRLGRAGAPTLGGFEVSPDGRWVALAHSFEIRRNAALSSPGLVALVVARSDASDPRCVGIGVPSDDPPPFTFSRAGRLVGDWSVRCEPGPRGVPLAIDADGELDAWPRLQRWYDPDDGSGGVVPELEPWWYDRDPLGDHVAMQHYEDPRALEFRNFATGARLGAVPIADGLALRPRDWVTADMLLAEALVSDPAPRELRLVTTDGRSFTAPHAQWRVYTRLPDGSHVFSRDGGATIEQGRVDWPRFTVEASRRRRDLEPFVQATAPGDPRIEPTWTPGLGGLLVLDHETGNLYLAAI